MYSWMKFGCRFDTLFSMVVVYDSFVGRCTVGECSSTCSSNSAVVVIGYDVDAKILTMLLETIITYSSV